ncbi:uncharacterized protein LOC105190396 isoform X1 [Harpegnathos saltator]|uniref:uncharacterized protein LOC105190396 isoform X1 n=1 Tax=Harpegnathos saltator TaxID=610380 RepID=UPI000DBED944|nr:uncharacterized protein LOC105190396 isoform X1 [Harpegnathos saltator]
MTRLDIRALRHTRIGEIRLRRHTKRGFVPRQERGRRCVSDVKLPDDKDDPPNVALDPPLRILIGRLPRHDAPSARDSTRRSRPRRARKRRVDALRRRRLVPVVLRVRYVVRIAARLLHRPPSLQYSYRCAERRAGDGRVEQHDIRIERLRIDANAISDISLRAFDGLLELAVLDLSQNRLHYLHAETFVPTASLRILQLSRNDFNSHVPKLRSPSLMNLAMDSCQISYIPADTFAGLSHLRSLDLSNNLMIQLDSITLQPLKLRQLAITGNPWSCNKLMHDLELYLTGKNIEHDTVCGKNTGPKKFEKMIVYDPHVKYEKHRPSIIANVNTKNALTPRKDLTPVPTIKDASICGNATAESDLTKTLNAISPYWFFVFGFLLGSACATFTTYIWLTKRIICCRRYRERRNNDIQRVSLLQNLWQFDDPAFNDNETRHETRSCPGTPPPPYREVMSRPGLYRSPSVNTNNSAART